MADIRKPNRRRDDVQYLYGYEFEYYTDTLKLHADEDNYIENVDVVELTKRALNSLSDTWAEGSRGHGYAGYEFSREMVVVIRRENNYMLATIDEFITG